MKRVRTYIHHLHMPDLVAHSTKRIVRSFRDNVQLGTLLAFIAGNINSIAFVHFGTYVSHVSGHATRAAINYAEGEFTSAFLFLLEFGAFIFGAGITAFLLKGHTAASSLIKYTTPIFLELFLVLVYMISAVLNSRQLFTSPYFSHLTFLLAIAMGIQNAMLRQASGFSVRTTHMTGVATDFGFELGAAVRLFCDVLLVRHSTVLARLKAAGRAFLHRLGVSRFFFHGFIIFSFSSGALVGTLGYLLYQDFALTIPIVTLLLIGIREYRRKLEVKAQPSPTSPAIA
ncbi:MAG: DUF1275 domain-containing protein [Oligoflexus sp.]|nr:DUF1275 domain-containing protein [Oligoflexus sp.]